MVQKVKDRIVGGTIGTVSGIIIGLFLLFFGGARADTKAFKELVNNKVDVEVFNDFRIENEKEHKEIESEIKTEFSKDLTDLEKRLNREADIRNHNLEELIKSINK